MWGWNDERRARRSSGNIEMDCVWRQFGLALRPWHVHSCGRPLSDTDRKGDGDGDGGAIERDWGEERREAAAKGQWRKCISLALVVPPISLAHLPFPSCQLWSRFVLIQQPFMLGNTYMFFLLMVTALLSAGPITDLLFRPCTICILQFQLS